MFNIRNNNKSVVNTGAVYTAKYVANKAMILLNDQRAYMSDAEYRAAANEISRITVGEVNNAEAVRNLAAKWNIDIEAVARLNKM